MANSRQPSRPFKEVQNFTSPLIWIFFSVLLITFFIILFITIFNDLYPGNFSQNKTSASDYLIIILAILFVIGLMYLFKIMRLEIIIDNENLFFAYKPFLKRNYPLNEILEFKERKYRPLIEYRGWGIRYSLFGNGKAYTVKGNTGVQFLTRNGKKFLLGSQKPAELIYFLNRLINDDKINS